MSATLTTHFNRVPGRGVEWRITEICQACGSLACPMGWHVASGFARWRWTARLAARRTRRLLRGLER